MRVRILAKPSYGDKHGNYFDYGTIVEWPEPLALKLIRFGIAEAAPAPVIETVAAAPTKNAAKRIGRTKPRKAV